jgi:sacsin
MWSSSAMPPVSPREHVERIRRERYFIGRGEQNPLAEDMHQAVNYLSQELYSKDVHFLMELIQVYYYYYYLHPACGIYITVHFDLYIFIPDRSVVPC